MASSNDIQIVVRAEVKKAIDNLNKLKKTGKESATGIKGAFEKLQKNFLAVVAGVAASSAAFRKAIGTAKQFEQAIADVGAVVGGSVAQLEKFAREAGKNTVFTATEAAGALKLLAQAGLDAAAAGAVLEPTLNLAAAAGIGIAEATNLAVSNMITFGIEMENAAEVGDLFVATTQKSNTNLTQLGYALEDSAAAAAGAGIKIKDLSTIIGAMANRGIKGSKAGIQLRQAIARLQKPTAGAQKALEKYGITTEEISELLPTPIELFKRLAEANLAPADALEIFGVRQQGVISVIRSGIPDLERLSSVLDDVGGSAKRAADKQIDTLDGSLRLLGSAFEELLISAVKDGGILDLFKGIVDGAREVIQFINGMPGPIKTIGVAAAIATPAVIALMVAFGPLAAGVAAGIVALTALSALMIDQTDVVGDLESATGDLVTAETELMEVQKKLKNPLKELTDNELLLLKAREALLKQKIIQSVVKLGKAYVAANVGSSGFFKSTIAVNNILEATIPHYEKTIKRIQAVTEKREADLKAAEKSGASDAKLIRMQDQINEGYALAIEKMEQVTNFKLELAENNYAEAAGIEAAAKAIRNQSITYSELRGVYPELIKLIRQRVAEMKKEEEEAQNGADAEAARNADRASKDAALQARLLAQRKASVTAFREFTYEDYDLAIIALDEHYETLLEMQGLNAEERFGIEEEYETRLQQMKLERAGETLAQQSALLGQFSKISTAIGETRVNVINTQYQKDLENLKKSLNSGAISEKEYQEKVLALEKEKNEKTAKARRTQAIADKATGIVMAAINTAIGITSALTLPPPVSFVMAALHAALGIAQVAVIASKPIPAVPSFAVGSDYIPQDMIAQVHKGERIIPAAENAKLSNDGGIGKTINIYGNLELPGVSDAEGFINQLEEIEEQTGSRIIKR